MENEYATTKYSSSTFSCHRKLLSLNITCTLWISNKRSKKNDALDILYYPLTLKYIFGNRKRTYAGPKKFYEQY